MDDKEARDILRQHTKALEKVLGEKQLSSDSVKHAKNAAKSAKALKKSFIDRIKEFPVVEKVTSLGTAGTVAVSTAAVTQTELAVNYTEVVVAQVAEDVYTGEITPPAFIDTFVDFSDLHVWGQQVIAEKIAEVSELQPTSQPSSVGTDPTPESSSSSQGTVSDTPSQTQSTEQNQSSEKTESKTEQKTNSSNEETSDEAKATEDKTESTQQGKTENGQESQEVQNASETSQEPELDIVKTPFDNNIDNDIKPHRMVSPTN